MSAAAVFTHRRSEDTHDAVVLLIEIARSILTAEEAYGGS